MENKRSNERDKELAQRLSRFFSPERIEALARSTKFLERKTSRLTGQMFLEMNLFNLSGEKENSLSDQSDYLEDTYGIEMRKQSLDERYNTYSVAFMKRCYETLLSEVLRPYTVPLENNAVSVSGLFNGIELVDATLFELPSSLSVFYKGGGNSNASVKLHHRYELMSGETSGIKIVSGNENDACYLHDSADVFTEGRLYMKDLGYLNLEHFGKIAEAKGYFLSRFKSILTCYVKNESGEHESVNMADLVPAYGDHKEIPEIYIGHKKLKVRMCITPVPEEFIEERKKRVVGKNKKNGCDALHENALMLCMYNIFITNVPASLLIIGQIRQLYALRWQIELVFKVWKSVFDIDKVKRMNIFRFETHLYGRLMAILLSQKIQNLYRDYLWEEEEVEISEFKCAVILKKN